MKTFKIHVSAILIVLSTLAGCALVVSSATAETVIDVKSTNDWIGLGRNARFTPADGPIYAYVQEDKSITMWFLPSDADRWFFQFAPPQGEVLAVGTYDYATRYPFQSPKRPALTVSAGTRGCENINGRFTILEIEVGPENEVVRFAADLEQWCDVSRAPLFVSVRINSSMAVVPRFGVGDTTALKGNAGSNDGLMRVSLSMPSTKVETVQVSTSDRSAINGIDYSGGSITVSFAPGETTKSVAIPILGNTIARGNRKLLLRLGSGTAPIADRSGVLTILDPNIPLTALLMNSDRLDFVGFGYAWNVTSFDTAFTSEMLNAGNVQVRTRGPDNWFLIFEAPGTSEQVQPLLPGRYPRAVRPISRSAAQPGLDVAGSGRGCNTVTGQFTVNQITSSATGGIGRLSVDFIQHCDGEKPALYGSLRLNSLLRQASITNAVLQGQNAVFTITLNPPSAQEERVEFSTANGTAAAGTDYTSTVVDLRFSPGQTSTTVSVPLLGTVPTGRRFFGTIKSQKTPIWIGAGSARIQ